MLQQEAYQSITETRVCSSLFSFDMLLQKLISKLFCTVYSFELIIDL